MHDDALGSTHSMEVSRAEGTKHTQAQRLPMAAASHHNLVALLGTGSIVHSHPAMLAGLNAWGISRGFTQTHETGLKVLLWNKHSGFFTNQ